MNLTDIALNNLRRRKIKMIFLLFGMVFGVATIVTLFSINQAMQEQMKVTFQESGSKVIVRPDADTISFSYSGITIASDMTFDVKELHEDAISKLEAMEKIDIVSPKLLDAVEIDGVKRVIAGVIFDKEMVIKDHWDVVGEVPSANNEVLIGSEAAMKIKRGPGDSLLIKDQEFEISGVISETGQEEDGLIFINLKTAQTIFEQPGNLSFIEVNAFRNKDVTQEERNVLITEIKQVLPETKVTALQEVLESRKELLDRFNNFAWVVSGIVLVIGSLIVTTTMMSSVNERTREIGIFRAIGFRKQHVMRIILTEAGIVSVISAIIGYLMGMGVAMAVGPMIAQAQVKISWNPLLAIGVLILATLIGILASYYPAQKASKLDPAEALRFI